MINLDACLDTICHFVSIYKNQNKRPLDIYRDSDYKKYYHHISIEKIVGKLISDESIVKDWIQFSEDKRWTPAWALYKNQNGKWTLSRIENNGKPSYELIYEDRLLACAHMIKYEMEDLRLGER